MSALQKIPVLILFILLKTITAFGQDADTPLATQLQELVDSVEFIYGSDDILVNGKVYIPQHIKAKGHPYLLEDAWRQGSLVMKGRTYHHLELKYNIDIDRLILRNKTKASTFQYVLINNQFLESFTLGESRFINASLFLEGSAVEGIYELIYQGEFIFLVKHRKIFVGEFSNNTPHGKFSGFKPAFYIYDHTELSKVFSKKSLLKYFEPHKQEIKKFLKQHKINYKKATNNQLYELMKYCDQLIPLQYD